MGIQPDAHYSPSLLDKIAYAGGNKASFREASQDLAKLAELSVSEKQVERLSERIGMERVAQREAEVAAFEALTLKERCDSTPEGVAVPVGQVAVVMADAGTLQLRGTDEEDEEPQTADEPILSPACADPLLASATDAPPGVAAAAEPQSPGGIPADQEEEDDDEERSSKHWRQDRVGLTMTMSSAVHGADPCPQIPDTFVDPLKIPKLVRSLKAKVVLGEDGLVKPDADEEEQPLPLPEYEAPKLETRKVVASRQKWASFGPMLANAAWRMGFATAQRKAFVADGAKTIWRLWRRFFSSYVPVLDFIHALSYVFAAAMAVGGDLVRGWPLYVQWIGWVWQGNVAQVIETLKAWQQEHGQPQDSDGETHPRRVVARALSYLQNNESRMKYHEYRQRGLPITSSLMESMVKQVSRRVKGTEKFWSDDGAEAILQLRADYLSDGEVMEEFWERRQNAATGRRNYRKAA